MKLFFSGFLVMVLILGAAQVVRAQESSLVGKKAPDFTLARLSGRSVSLSELIKDKKAILFFYATWCPHCREQLKNELDKEGILVQLVDIGEPKDKVAAFQQAKGIDNDTFLDEQSLVAETYEVLGVPMLVFIGTDGKVRDVEYGLPENYQEILK